jgi:hypothetical protein
MPLSQFRIAGFQSYYDEQTLDLEPHITFVAGRNDVGKSALLRAMRVFAEPQEGARRDCRIGYTWEVPSDAIWRVFSTRATAGLEHAFRGHESLILEATFALRPAPVTTPADSMGISSDVLVHIDIAVQQVLGRAGGPPGYAAGWKGGPFNDSTVGVGEVAGVARALASDIRYVGPRAIELAEKTVLPSPVLEPSGRNLTDVLVHLRNSEPAINTRLTEFIREAFPQIEDIVVPPSSQQGAGYMGEPTVYYAGTRARRIPLRHCGTGVLQMLVLGVAVMTAPPGHLILIDEPQAYLHPHAERTLFELLAAHPEHQYVVATHSHATLAQAGVAQTRLIATDDGASRVTAGADPASLLDELGVSAADLWLADALIWVEGPSDVAAIERVLRGDAPRATRVSTVVKALPDASQASSGARKTVERTYKLVSALAAAVLPMPVRMTFLFDGDEKTDEERQRIDEASRGQAVFLEVREIENYFLASPDVIGAALAARLEPGTTVDPDDIATRVQSMLGEHGDAKLFPAGVRLNPVADVKGSELLDRLWWDLSDSRYDKVADAARLVDAALELAPASIQPLRDIIGKIVSRDG